MDQFIEIFAILFAAAGPIKVSVAFAALTAHASPALRRAMAFRIVGAASIIGVVLTLAGKILVDLFHFSLPALEIAGGTLLFIYATKMVFFESEPEYVGENLTESDAAHLALFPLTIPMLISPATIVVLLTLSVTHYQSVPDLIAIIALLLGLMLINGLILLLAARLPATGNPIAWQVIARTVGVLIAAFGVEIAMTGLAAYGIGVVAPH